MHALVPLLLTAATLQTAHADPTPAPGPSKHRNGGQARGAGKMADRHPQADRRRLCPGACARLQSQTLAGARALRHTRRPAHRQQPDRKCHPPDRVGQEELAVRRLRGRGPARRGHPVLARHCARQRHRADALAHRNNGKAAELAQQPHRRVAAHQKNSPRATIAQVGA